MLFCDARYEVEPAPIKGVCSIQQREIQEVSGAQTGLEKQIRVAAIVTMR